MTNSQQTPDLPPAVPGFLNDTERDNARTEITRLAAERAAAEGTNSGSISYINPLFLPVELQQKFAARAADGYTVPIGTDGTPDGELIDDPNGGTRHDNRVRPFSPSIAERAFALLSVMGVLALIAALGAPTLLKDLFETSWSVRTAAVVLLLMVVIPDRLNKRRVARWEEHHRRYGFTASDVQTIRDCAVDVPNHAPEMILAAVARQCADTISHSEAWADPILDSHRLRFDPDHEAAEIRQHALNIASLRIHLGDRDVTNDHTVTAARRDINNLLTSLTDRVAALWAYTDKIDKLSEPLRDLHTIRAAIDALPAIDEAARQMGIDELATHKLQQLADDADTITITIEELAADLTKRLRAPR